LCRLINFFHETYSAPRYKQVSGNLKTIFVQ
jgi:hypothetical protein